MASDGECVTSQKPHRDNGDVVMQVPKAWSPMDANVKKAMTTVKQITDCGDAVPNKMKPKAIKRGSGIKKHGSKTYHKKRLQLLMELKVRMDLLKEMEGFFPPKRMMKEKQLLFRALPNFVPVEEVRNRQAYLMETKLRMELLKDMKGVVPQKRYWNHMKSLFLGLPPLAANSKVADSKDREGSLEIAAIPKQNKNGEAYMDTEDEWEEVEEVNAAVADVEIA